MHNPFFLRWNCSMLVGICLLSVSATALDTTVVSSDTTVSARAAILTEADSGQVLYRKNAEERLPMASTTKIMTALVAIEDGNLSREVTVSAEAVGIEGSGIYLQTGDKLTLDDLVWALLLESANDAATAIAVEVAGSVEAFAGRMNERAAALGMTDTHFTNPHGLDNDAHFTTAADLAKLTEAALKNQRFAEIVGTYRHTITIDGEPRYLLNHNKLLKYYSGTIGVKTGYTKRSGRCLVSAAEKNGVRLIAVTLDAPDDWNDHKKLYDNGFSCIESVDLIQAGESVWINPCIGCESGEIMLSNHDGLTVSLPVGHGEITRRIEMPRYFWATVAKGDIVGRIVFELDGESIGEVPIYADETAEQIQYPSSIWERLFG